MCVCVCVGLFYMKNIETTNGLWLISELHEECIKDEKVLVDATFPYWNTPVTSNAVFVVRNGVQFTIM